MTRVYPASEHAARWQGLLLLVWNYLGELARDYNDCGSILLVVPLDVLGSSLYSTGSLGFPRWSPTRIQVTACTTLHCRARQGSDLPYISRRFRQGFRLPCIPCRFRQASWACVGSDPRQDSSTWIRYLVPG